MDISYGNHLKGEIEITKPQIIFENKFITINNDIVKFPGGNSGTYIRVNSPTNKSVAVLPVTPEGKIVVIRNYRHGVRGWGVEVPKGGVDEGESHTDAVARELSEETGYSYEKLIPLGEYSESPAIFAGKLDCYIALNCRPAAAPEWEETESISGCFEIDVHDFLARKYDADFIDSVSELLVYRYLHVLGE